MKKRDFFSGFSFWEMAAVCNKHYQCWIPKPTYMGGCNKVVALVAKCTFPKYIMKRESRILYKKGPIMQVTSSWHVFICMYIDFLQRCSSGGQANMFKYITIYIPIALRLPSSTGKNH